MFQIEGGDTEWTETPDVFGSTTLVSPPIFDVCKFKISETDVSRKTNHIDANPVYRDSEYTLTS